MPIFINLYFPKQVVITFQMKYQIAKKKYLKYTHWVFANYPHKLEESQDWICCHRYTLWRHSHYCTGWHCIVVLLLHRTVMYHLKHATHAIVHFETIQQIHQSISTYIILWINAGNTCKKDCDTLLIFKITKWYQEKKV